MDDIKLRVRRAGAEWWVDQIGPSIGPFATEDRAVAEATDRAQKLVLSGFMTVAIDQGERGCRQV